MNHKIDWGAVILTVLMAVSFTAIGIVLGGWKP